MGAWSQVAKSACRLDGGLHPRLHCRHHLEGRAKGGLLGCGHARSLDEFLSSPRRTAVTDSSVGH